VVIIGGMMALLFLPRLLLKGTSAELAQDFWWTTPLLALAALIFYAISLRLTTVLFRARREQLMALMEGRG
jgi:uncharacterized membrane protein YraQ (UPF0718 family)